MSPPSAQLVETLRAKAMLLLQREREIAELRDMRRRAEEWLRAFRALDPLFGDGVEELIATWAAVVVGGLGFEIAGAIEYEPSSSAVRFHVTDPAREGPPARLSPESIAFLEETPSGVDHGGKAEALGADLALQKFLWFRFATRRNTAVVIFAGYSQRTAALSAIAREDHAHFVMLGNHLASLVSNCMLVQEVSRDRSTLREANRELRETQQKLIESTRLVAEVSRRAGMADIATGVLHNVGNVLNSVNVSAEIIAERIRASKLSSLTKVVDLLQGNEDDLARFLAADDKGKKTVVFLRALADQLAHEDQEMLTEVRSLQGHLDHIKTIVAKQQAYATTVAVIEDCAPAQLVEDALALVSASFLRHDVRIVRDYEEISPVPLDRHKLLQIVVNLLENAKQAVVTAARPDKTITVRVRAAAGRFRIEVEDNGIGIHEKHRSRLFTHGFTTKPNGHGFGLHTSAVAAQELGGRLSCTSEGEGRGATFVLELPLGGRGSGEEGG